MKKTCLLLAFAAFYLFGFTQMNDSTYKQTLKTDYLRKSKNQRTTGFILLGVGTAMTLTGVILMSNVEDDPLNPQAWAEAGGGAGLSTIGALSMVGSIPFFISSSSNKKRAAKMSAGLSVEKLMHEKVRIPYPKHYPALTARLSF